MVPLAESSCPLKKHHDVGKVGKMNVTIYTPKGKPCEPKDFYELIKAYNPTGYKEVEDTKELCSLEQGTIVWVAGLGIFLVNNNKLRSVCRS